MGISRSKFKHVFSLALAASMAGTVVTSTASAQSSDSGWGAEARIGSGQYAYLLRSLNANWSLVLGGGFSVASSDSPVNGSNNSKTRSGNLVALVRREWGTGRVHPTWALGPQLTFAHSTSTTIVNGTAVESTSDNLGLGGRAEFGAIADVHESVGLGIVFGATAGRNESTFKAAGSTAETKSNSNSFSIGNPQFIVRVRF